MIATRWRGGEHLGRWLRALSAIVVFAVAACATHEPYGTEPPPVAPVAADRAAFDSDASAHFLADGDARFAAGDLAGAAESYEAAALLWPDRIDAWRGLGAVADARGDAEAAAAADFIAQRVYLFPSGSLAVQRDYRVALLAYIDDQEKAADPNRLQLTYAHALADYYAYRYGERGTYQPPELPFLDVRWVDAPAVAVTGILMAVYGLTVSRS